MQVLLVFDIGFLMVFTTGGRVSTKEIVFEK